MDNIRNLTADPQRKPIIISLLLKLKPFTKHSKSSDKQLRLVPHSSLDMHFGWKMSKKGSHIIHN